MEENWKRDYRGGDLEATINMLESVLEEVKKLRQVGKYSGRHKGPRRPQVCQVHLPAQRSEDLPSRGQDVQCLQRGRTLHVLRAVQEEKEEEGDSQEGPGREGGFLQ